MNIDILFQIHNIHLLHLNFGSSSELGYGWHYLINF